MRHVGFPLPSLTPLASVRFVRTVVEKLRPGFEVEIIPVGTVPQTSDPERRPESPSSTLFRTLMDVYELSRDISVKCPRTVTRSRYTQTYPRISGKPLEILLSERYTPVLGVFPWCPDRCRHVPPLPSTPVISTTTRVRLETSVEVHLLTYRQSPRNVPPRKLGVKST